MKKVNKRRKGELGLLLAGIGAALAAITGGVSMGINADAQRRQNRQAYLNANNQASLEHDSTLQSNINNTPDVTRDAIPTLSSKLKCGGKKRIKKLYGGNDIIKYI